MTRMKGVSVFSMSGVVGVSAVIGGGSLNSN
jgi:hypothetical protein